MNFVILNSVLGHNIRNVAAMKIAIICPDYPPARHEGGISHYTRCLSHQLAHSADEICILTNAAYTGDQTDGRVCVLKFEEPWNFSAVRRMKTMLQKRAVELVNLQYSPVLYPTGFKFSWPYLRRCFATVVSLHTLWGGSKINYLAAMWLLATASGIIATNSEVLYLIRKFFPFYHQKTRLVPIGPNIIPEANKKAYAKITKKYLPDINGPVLIHFGMPYPGKGIKRLLKASRILKKQYRLDIHLVVIGGGVSESSTYIQKRKDMAAALGLNDHVIWTGRISAEAVSALVFRGDIVVLPFESGVSDRRGSLMAALAHRKAIVTTPPAIPLPLFKNGVNMVWPERDDAETLAATLYTVLKDKNLRRSLEDGAAALVKNFNWAQIAVTTRAWFGEISKTPPPS